MSKKSNRRLETRSQRTARDVASAPRARRPRAPRARRGPSGLSNISFTAILAVFGGAALLGIIIFAFLQSTATRKAGDPDWLKAELNSSASLPGKYIKSHPGADGKFGTTDDRGHRANNVKIPICTPEQIAQDEAITDVYAERQAVAECYTSNPPTSGPHSGNPMGFKVLENPAPKENLLHNMEHGGVVIWYNTEDAAIIKELAAIAEDYLSRRKLVVMTKYTEMEPDTIALTAWTRLDKFPVSAFTKKRVQDFINAHERRFNPEGM